MCYCSAHGTTGGKAAHFHSPNGRKRERRGYEFEWPVTTYRLFVYLNLTPVNNWSVKHASSNWPSLSLSVYHVSIVVTVTRVTLKGDLFHVPRWSPGSLLTKGDECSPLFCYSSSLLSSSSSSILFYPLLPLLLLLLLLVSFVTSMSRSMRHER